MKREILFKAQEQFIKRWVYGYLICINGSSSILEVDELNISTKEIPVNPDTVCQFTGLTDSKNEKGFFGDIWLVKDYTYQERFSSGGYKTHKTDLKFYLVDDDLDVKYVLIDQPETLKNISLSVIFNLPTKNGKRIFIDDYRKRIEIIGNIHD